MSCSRLTPVALLAASLVLPTLASSQVLTGERSNSSALLIGLSANGMSITTEDDDGSETTESGAGFGAMIGWGFTPKWTGILGVRAAKLEMVGGYGEYTVAQFDLGARYTFREEQHVARPYIDLLLSGRGLSTEVTDGVYSADLEASGGGVTFDVGSQFFFTPTVAFDVALGYTVGKFGDPKIDGESIPGAEDMDANSGHFRIGLSFRPLLRR